MTKTRAAGRSSCARRRCGHRHAGERSMPRSATVVPLPLPAAREGATVVLRRPRRGRRRGNRRRDPRRRRVRLLSWSPTFAVEEDCQRLVEDAGELTDLVLNVGIGRGGGLARTTADDWDVTFQVNLRSHFLVTRAALPRLPEAGPSSSSARSRGCAPEPRPRLRRVQGGDHRLVPPRRPRGRPPRVRANVVAPGLIDTPSAARRPAEGRPRERTPVPLGVRARRGRWRPWSSFCFQATRRTSPARSSRSTEACTSSDRAK